MPHFIPAASYRLLTPLYDGLAAVAGVGEGFKARVAAAARIGEGARVLDMGCGTGVLAEAVTRRHPGCQVTGLDVDRGILAIASRRLAPLGRAQLLCASAGDLPIVSGSIDTVLATLMLHHLPAVTKARAMAEVARVLRPGGTFYIVDIGPARPRVLSPDQMHSFRWAYASNAPGVLLELLIDAGFDTDREPPPAAGLMTRWTFALRGRKGFASTA